MDDLKVSEEVYLMELLDPTSFTEWLSPHSLEWYEQLSKIQHKYLYTWDSTLSEPNGESMFDKDILQIIANKSVLDVGCGHGDFTLECRNVAKEIVGFDVTEHFIQKANENKKANVTFVLGNTKEGLPFEADEFDCAYIRKGPTSAYPLLKRVVKKGGEIVGLHPGDETGKELPIIFPNLFSTTVGTPILNTIKRRLQESTFTSTNIEVISSTEYLKSPQDVIQYRCFGQQPVIYERLIEENLNEINKIFNRNATEEGLPITHSRYIVHVTV